MMQINEKQGKILNQQDLDKQVIQKFALLINTYVQTTSFTVIDPSVTTLFFICQLWNTRRVYDEDKKLILKVEQLQLPKDKVIQIFSNLPSIVLQIDGEEIPNKNFLKSDNFYHYEGTQQQMLIYNKQTASNYHGPVKSLTELEPEGFGIKTDSPNTKEAVTYKGYFHNGKKHGYGVEMKKNCSYQGNWQNNEKHGWGRQVIKRKKKYIQKQQKQQKQRNEKQNKKSQKTEQQILQVQNQQDQEIKQKQEQEQQQQQQGQKKKVKRKELSQEKIKQLLKFLKSIYEGPFQKGVKSGEGGIQYTKNGTYIGDWSGNLRHGKGTMKYRGGAIYQGQWKNNIIQGVGKYTDQAKNIYEGQFQNGLYDGQGTMKYVNGDEYTGQWSQGRKQGKGVYNYADGDYYDGQWVKDEAEGNATSMISGIFYEGTYVKGVKHGYGEQTNEQGDVIKGIWKKGVLVQIISKNGVLENEEKEQTS